MEMKAVTVVTKGLALTEHERILLLYYRRAFLRDAKNYTCTLWLFGTNSLSKMCQTNFLGGTDAYT